MHMILKGFAMMYKFGFVKATIDFSLNRDDLKEKVREYIETIVKEDK